MLLVKLCMLLINFFKRQWLGTILIIIFIVSTFVLNSEEKELLQKEKQLSLKIKNLEKKDKESAKRIDSLSKQDVKIVRDIRIVKETEYEELHIVDSLPISGLQKYFTDRYPQR